jgi:AbrB family looped-hinge helix DNA binding protein
VIWSVLAQKLFVEKAGLLSQHVNQIKRVATFQNAEFYKKQGLRLSTALTPRVITCAEDLPEYVALPRRCCEDVERAKEGIFSFRSAQHHWDPKNQRPELWRVYNCRKHQRESIRVFPLSNWTELDVWQYVHRERIPVVPLYFAKERPVVERNGALSTIALPLTTIPDSLRYECMKLQEGGRAMAAVKVGVSRQVVIPKKIHDKLGLAPGDYLEVEVERGKVVMTPKTLVDKQLEKRLAEGLEDFRAGRSHGPFDSAKDAARYLHTEAKRRRKVKAS